MSLDAQLPFAPGERIYGGARIGFATVLVRELRVESPNGINFVVRYDGGQQSGAIADFFMPIPHRSHLVYLAWRNPVSEQKRPAAERALTHPARLGSLPLVAGRQPAEQSAVAPPTVRASVPPATMFTESSSLGVDDDILQAAIRATILRHTKGDANA